LANADPLFSVSTEFFTPWNFVPAGIVLIGTKI